MEYAQKILVWKPEGNMPLGRSTHRWENNITTDVIKMECQDVGCLRGF